MIRLHIEKINDKTGQVIWAHTASIGENGIGEALNHTVGVAAHHHDDEELETPIEAFLSAALPCDPRMVQSVFRLLLLAQYGVDSKSIKMTLDGPNGLAHLKGERWDKAYKELLESGIQIVNSDGKPLM